MGNQHCKRKKFQPLPGVKRRVLDQGDGGRQASIFLQDETNGRHLGQRKDIAVAGPRWLLPVKVSKRLELLDVEGGYFLSRKEMPERIVGIAAGRSASDPGDLAMQVYSDRAIGAAPATTTLDVGERFKLRRGVIALFMAGRSVDGRALKRVEGRCARSRAMIGTVGTAPAGQRSVRHSCSALRKEDE